MADDEKTHMTTNLQLPMDLRREIADAAKADEREFKPTIRVLLREALDARKMKRA